MRLIAILMLVLGALGCASQQGTQTRELVYQGNITGYDFDEYKLSLNTNDKLTANIDVRQLDVIIFNPMSLTLENDKPVTITQSGEYTLRVLMPRAFARRGESYDYRLVVSIDSAK